MKTKLSLFFIFLLAIGGGASAQQVLFICSTLLPCPGFPLGSVQAGIDQNGWRHFKLTLTSNVTLFQFVGTPPPAQAVVNVIFTQDGVGGRTVTFASNITSPCSITTAANSTTLCQFEYDGVAGIFIGISSGLSVALAQGQQLVGGASGPIAQNKPAVDARDSAANFDCTGTTAMDTGMQSISSTAHVIIPTGCMVRLSSAHSYPQSFEFKQGGQLRPDTGVLITMTGPILAGSSQIFSNALVGQGGIDFTGNHNQFDILPEWWGAAAGAVGATNITAIQAAIYGAFGCNTSPATACRTNASGNSFYNKPIKLTGNYAINGELKLYHVLNFLIDCRGRLQGGITQFTTNARIFDGQSDAYGSFLNCSWATQASEDLAHPLMDLNFDGSQGVDIKPQFIDFFSNTWNGNQLAKTGIRIAGAGGGAQGSNIHFYNNFAESFTEAAYMIGSGSGCNPGGANIANNAISIMWFGGDMQSNNAYGIEDYGGTNIVWDGGTAENGGFLSIGLNPQTGADFCATNLNGGGGPFSVYNTRSESAYLLAGNSGFELYNVQSDDNATIPTPGNTPIVGDLIQGSPPCNHGLWNKVTAQSGAYSGLGVPGSPRSATSGTLTTLVDSVGGLTVNAWNGFNVCIQSGTGTNEFCTVASNTATTFTCSGNFTSDFPLSGGTGQLGTGAVAPDGTSRYTIEPNWGTATTDGGATFAIDNTTYSVANANSIFLPGKRLSLGNGAVLQNASLTRSDWVGTGIADDITRDLTLQVDVGSPPTAGVGNAGIGLSPPLLRSWNWTRNGITELTTFPLRQEFGTRTLHWFAGQLGGGVSTTDLYVGTDSNLPSTKQGDLFIINNSSGTAKKWTFNFDASMTAPGILNSTGAASPTCSAPTNGYFLPPANSGLSTFGGNTVDLCANGTRVMQVATTGVFVEAGNLGFSSGKGQHITPQAAASDISGTCTAAAVATCTVTFTTAYTSAPSCTVTDQTNITTVKALPSTTTLVITTSAASSDVFSYICIGNPN